MRQITGLDRLIDAINDSKLFGECDDETHSMQSFTQCGETITTEGKSFTQCGETITTEGKVGDFDVNQNPPLPCPRPRGGISNTDAIKMKSVIFVAPNAINANSTMRFLA